MSRYDNIPIRHSPAPRSPYGRPIVYQADPGCWHRVRRVGLLIDSRDRLHIIDACPVCGGRTEYIAYRDAIAEGVDPGELPVLRDTREAA